jgi:hypothetical protein
MRFIPRPYTLVRVAAVLVTVLGLFAGLGMRSAEAQALTAPVLLDVKGTSPTTIDITFRDTSEGEVKFQFFCYHKGGCPSDVYQTTYALPGRGSTHTITIPNLEPDGSYCFNARAYISEQNYSPKSNTYCGGTLGPISSPAPPPPTADLRVVRITNEEAGSQTGEQAAGTSKVYQIVVRNDGVRPPGTDEWVELKIQITGALEVEQFLSATDPPSGFRCGQALLIGCTGRLGGQGDAVQDLTALFRVRVKATAEGMGTLSATVLVHGAAENDTSNNVLSLSIKVTPAASATRPNLVVSGISGPKARHAGESGVYEVTVSNTGKGDAGPTDLVLSVSGPLTFETLRLPGICTGTATELRCNGIAALVSGESTTLRFEARAGQQVGTGQLSARVNPSGSVSESDTSDNQRVLLVTVSE